MLVEMDVLWRRCSVKCRMYERGKEVRGSDCDNPDCQGRRGWVFKLQSKNFTSSVLCFVVCLQLWNHNSEREEESAKFKHMYSTRSPHPLIDTDMWCLTTPTRVTQARTLLSFMCLRSARVLRQPSPPLLSLQLID